MTIWSHGSINKSINKGNTGNFLKFKSLNLEMPISLGRPGIDMVAFYLAKRNHFGKFE